MQLFSNLITLLPVLQVVCAYYPDLEFSDGSGQYLVSRDLDTLLQVREMIDADISILLPRVDRDANGNPIIPYRTKTQPQTVANKLDPSNPIPDKLTPLPSGSKQYRGDAAKDKKTNPVASGQFKDHGLPSSSVEGKKASQAGTNPLKNVPSPEQRIEAGKVSAAMQVARKEGKQAAVRIDGQKPSGIIKPSKANGGARIGSTPTRVQPSRDAKKKTRRSVDFADEDILVERLVARALDILIEDGEAFTDLYM